jgi:Flp pilus assembly secretin CpaC
MMRIALLSVIAALAACDPTLEALTAPPPGAKAELDNDEDIIHLSRGAALAVACTDGGDLCDNMSVTVADPLIAGARVAFRNALDFTFEGQRPATSFVIFGKAAGKTDVTVKSSAGDVTYRVHVID